MYSIYLHLFIGKGVDNNKRPFELSWVSARFWRCCLNYLADVRCFWCTSSSFTAQGTSLHTTELWGLRALRPPPWKHWQSKTASGEEWGKETRVYWVKGKVRFPSASIVPLVKEQALEIKWSESRAWKCWGICIQLEKFWMDTHNILACTSILFVRADAGSMLQFKKSLELNWHKELHMWSQHTYKHTLS